MNIAFLGLGLNRAIPAQPGKRRDEFAEAVLDCVAAVPAARWHG